MSKFEEEWQEITEEEFLSLKKRAVKGHTVTICEPPVSFYWDEEGAKNSDLSFGQHAFLSYIRESKGPEPYVWPSQYWKKI